MSPYPRMLPLPQQPPSQPGPRRPAEEAGTNSALTKMAATIGQGAEPSAVGLSRPFLCFRFLMLAARFRQCSFSFLVLGAPGAREGRVACRDWGEYSEGKAGLPRPVGSDATVAAADRWNGRWVQVPAWPGPDCGTDASGERQRKLTGGLETRASRPWDLNPPPWPGAPPCT